MRSGFGRHKRSTAAPATGIWPIIVTASERTRPVGYLGLGWSGSTAPSASSLARGLLGDCVPHARHPRPHFPVATCGLTPLPCVMFVLIWEYVAGSMPIFGREVKKPLAFVFLFMRIFWPGATLAGVFDTSSPPKRFPACPARLESTAPWWGRIWGGSW
jgi:hypothetical protein